MKFAVRTTLLLIIAGAVLFNGRPAAAQNGRLIESIFKTLAEQQIEKERRKRAEAERRPPAVQPPRQPQGRTDPFEVRLPSGFGSPRQAPPARTPQLSPGPKTVSPGSINVRSREVADFAKQLVSMNGAIDQLIPQLRAQAAKQTALRPILPSVYQVRTDGRTLLRRCDGQSSLAPVLDGYQRFDASWRQASFALRGVRGIDAGCTKLLQQCDQYSSAMCKQLQIQPQFDRVALRDNMLIAGAYMATLLDDLKVASVPNDHCRKLTHDCRLLRQRLLNAANHADEMTYQEAAQSFTAFVADWGKYAEQVYALRDPHLDRRLSRISEVGDQTYAVLWMAPPAAMHDIRAVCKRLDVNVKSLRNQITLQSIASLQPVEQLRVLKVTRQLYDNTIALQSVAGNQQEQRRVEELVGALANDWGSVQEQYFQIPRINRGLLAELGHSIDELRLAIGHNGAGHAEMSAERLIESAAALEGTSEYINKLVRDHSRKISSGSFRNSITDAAREFYVHSRELHEEMTKPRRLTDPRYLDDLQREAIPMVQAWNQLAGDMEQAQRQGMPAAAVVAIQRAQRDITPFVAQVAAALLQE